MKLEKPICFFDTETTGLDVKEDRIVELSITKVDVDGSKTVKTRRFNPEVEISKEATSIHGITNEDVANEPIFKKLAKGLHAFIDGCDLVGYHCLQFDCKLLFNEFKRAGITWDYSKSNIIDAGNLFKIYEERTLAAAYEFYCGKEAGDKAHGAEFDVNMTTEVFKAQLKKYNLTKTSMEDLATLSNYGNKILDIDGKFVIDTNGDPIFTFGKNKGKKVLENEGMLNWMMGEDFSENTLRFAEYFLNQIKNG